MDRSARKTTQKLGKRVDDSGSSKRFAARLLFQLRKETRRRSNVMRLVERRIMLISARNAEAAWRIAVRRGGKEEWTGQPRAGTLVHCEFIGIEELMELGGETDEEEVWWEFVAMLRPLERRSKLIPPKRRLRAFERGVIRRYGPKI